MTAAAALAGAHAVAACGSTTGDSGQTSTSGPPRAPTGTFRFPLESATTGFDPAYSGNLLADYIVAHSIFDRLVAFDSSYTRLVPALVTEWRQSDDAKEFVFTLRSGVRFHDGKLLDSSDLKATLQYYSGARGAFSALLLPPRFDTLDDSDPRRLRVVTPTPQPDFVRNQTFLTVMSAKAIAEGGEALKRKPVGSGAYRYKGRDGTTVIVEANPDYWGVGPYFEQIEFSVIADAGARINALLTGEVGMAYRVPPTQLQRIANVPRAGVVSGEVWSGVYIAFACNKPPFDDVRVRQACAYAIDKQAIIDAVARGQGKVAESFSPRGVVGWAPPAVRYAQDLEKARALLAQAGHAGGLRATMIVSTSQYLQPQLAQAVAGQLREIGIDARVRVVDAVEQSKVLLDTRQTTYDMFPTDFTWLTGGPVIQQLNAIQVTSRYDGRDLTDPLARMAVTPDGPRRDDAFAEFEGAFSRQVPMIPIFQSIYNDGLADGVGGYSETPKNGYGPDFFPIYAES